MPGRLPLRYQAPRPVDNHARDLPVLARATLGRNAYMYPCTRLVGETMNLGRGLVAEHRTSPHAQHHGPQLRLSGEVSGERCVGSAVRAPPRSRPKLPFDGLLGETRVACLSAGYDTGLA